MHSKKYKEYEIVLKASLEIIGIYLHNNEIDKAKMILNKDLEKPILHMYQILELLLIY